MLVAVRCWWGWWWRWGVGGGWVVVVRWRSHCGAGSGFVAADDSLSLHHTYARVNFSPLFSSCYIRLICAHIALSVCLSV